MAVCQLTGKSKQYGHNVSFSQRKTRKVFKPNLQKKTIRTLKKKGLITNPYKKQAEAEAA